MVKLDSQSFFLSRHILLNQTWDISKVLKRSIINKSMTNITTSDVCNLSYKIITNETESEENGEENPVKSSEPPVLLLHGLMGNKKLWEGIGKTIVSMVKRDAVVVDLRNHGDSPHMKSHKYEDLTADILHLITKLGIKQASFVGHSMGGKAAMCVALSAPQRVAGLLVVDISPVSTPPQYIQDFPKVMEAMKAITFKPKINTTTAQKEARVKLKHNFSITECAMRGILSNIVIKPDNIVGWACNIDVLIKSFKYISSFPSSMKGKTYNGPTMFLGGQLSDFIPPDDLPKIRTYFPKAVIKYVYKAGHNVHEDDPRSFMEETIKFLRSHHFKVFPAESNTEKNR